MSSNKNSMCLFPQKIEHFLFCEDFHFLPFNVHSEQSFSFFSALYSHSESIFLPFTTILSRFHQHWVQLCISYYDLIIFLQHSCLFISKVVSLTKVERHNKIGCVIIYWCITNYIAYSNRLFMLMIDCLRIWCRIPLHKFVRLALQIIIFLHVVSQLIYICSTKSKTF